VLIPYNLKCSHLCGCYSPVPPSSYAPLKSKKKTRKNNQTKNPHTKENHPKQTPQKPNTEQQQKKAPNTHTHARMQNYIGLSLEEQHQETVHKLE